MLRRSTSPRNVRRLCIATFAGIRYSFATGDWSADRFPLKVHQERPSACGRATANHNEQTQIPCGVCCAQDHFESCIEPLDGKLCVTSLSFNQRPINKYFRPCRSGRVESRLDRRQAFERRNGSSTTEDPCAQQRNIRMRAMASRRANDKLLMAEGTGIAPTAACTDTKHD